MTKPPAPKTLAQRITTARKTYRMTQTALADNIGKTRAAISQYEKAMIRPKDDVIERLARLFHTEPEWFTHGRGKAPSPIDAPVDIPEIDISRVTASCDLRNLKTHDWTLPMAAFDTGLAVSPDHLVAMVAPTHVAPIHPGDRVVVDTRRRNGPPGVFLIIDPKGAARLRHYGEDIPEGSETLGRVVAFFRTI